MATVGPSGVTEKAIAQGIAVMARHDKDRTPEQHETYVRAVVQGIREHLVQRHLYDAVVRELNKERGVA